VDPVAVAAKAVAALAVVARVAAAQAAARVPAVVRAAAAVTAAAGPALAVIHRVVAVATLRQSSRVQLFQADVQEPEFKLPTVEGIGATGVKGIAPAAGLDDPDRQPI
jgi:hypothetical protein